MIIRRIIYEFGEIPVKVGNISVTPSINLVKETGGKNVTVWINWLFERAERNWNPLYKKMYVTVVVWELGWGTYCYFYDQKD